jgi:hypothetical protein
MTITYLTTPRGKVSHIAVDGEQLCNQKLGTVLRRTAEPVKAVHEICFNALVALEQEKINPVLQKMAESIPAPMSHKRMARPKQLTKNQAQRATPAARQAITETERVIRRNRRFRRARIRPIVSWNGSVSAQRTTHLFEVA